MKIPAKRASEILLATDVSRSRASFSLSLSLGRRKTKRKLGECKRIDDTKTQFLGSRERREGFRESALLIVGGPRIVSDLAIDRMRDADERYVFRY